MVTPREVYERALEALRIIKDAQSKGLVHRTPLIRSETLSNVAGANVWLKLESLQKTGSFKVRGAYFAINNIVKRLGVGHVITASAGNHAQGVAYSASLVGIKATVVMPQYTPWIKIARTKRYGADVILHGESYSEAEEYATKLAKELGAYYVHAYNDIDVVAGQGTIGFEILEDLSNVDYVIVPIGGGGLISGIASVIKTVNPKVRVIGVQSEGAPGAYLSLRNGRIISVERVDTIADGIAVKRIGDLTFKLMSELLDDITLVNDLEIAKAILTIAESTKVIAEGAGAASVAALISNKVKVSGNAVVVVSGGNIDMSMLFRVISKALALEGRIVKISGLLPDRPGMLGKVTTTLGELGVNVLDVFHERFDPTITPGYAEVSFIVELPPEEDAANKVISRLRELGFTFNIEKP
ncbi:threonine ammonia-lyase [Vulcanisaeta souniana]|uniref:threonine ammonia-lyase n=1 Tax=Vulcanisaeta souniana JCM 11219 TaxID=1293586 RepID=A0A830ECF7_9CREN|nr:threonine ammonia-lyase [Vulcanisaeta souniana]BDR91982.1 threonine ammonia-lyase [Vulcanisaeta souniana JCM 11219]GGI68870.1 threonine ammonia-lyase [Vulcanisaeta souniana JCM 11219]